MPHITSTLYRSALRSYSVNLSSPSFLVDKFLAKTNITLPHALHKLLRIAKSGFLLFFRAWCNFLVSGHQCLFRKPNLSLFVSTHVFYKLHCKMQLNVFRLYYLATCNLSEVTSHPVNQQSRTAYHL